MAYRQIEYMLIFFQIQWLQNVPHRPERVAHGEGKVSVWEAPKVFPVTQKSNPTGACEKKHSSGEEDPWGN